MKLIESKQFDKIVRSKLKAMLEAKVSLPGYEVKDMSPEEIAKLDAQGVEYRIIKDDINTEVDKETWCEPKEEEEHPADCDCPECQAKKEAEDVNNDDMVIVDDEEAEEEPENIVDFLTKDSSDEVKPNEPAVLSEFDELSNEEKKALLLKLAKDDNDLDAILKAYMDKKCPLEKADEGMLGDVNVSTGDISLGK